MLRNIWVYRRYRKCENCLNIGDRGEEMKTVEMDESDFDKVCSELDLLRDFREAVLKALDVTNRKSDTPGVKRVE